MKKELSYMIINYTNSDHAYIDLICLKIEMISKEIVSFFEIKDDFKINITIFDNLDDFRNKIINEMPHLLEDNKVPAWICGVSTKTGIYTLSLAEYRKTKSHENGTINDIMYLILHEFTHSCFRILNKEKTCAWLSEGCATTISRQYQNISKPFTANLEDMEEGCSNYNNYHLMFKYVLDTYGKDYILKLIKNTDLVKNETPKLYNEVVNYYNKKTTNK
jgi:hypothetical protein